MGAHLCHARGCSVPVPPRMLMCRRHWFMVPRRLRLAVWAEYDRTGGAAGRSNRLQQYRDGAGPYVNAAEAAIAAVAEQEERARRAGVDATLVCRVSRRVGEDGGQRPCVPGPEPGGIPPYVADASHEHPPCPLPSPSGPGGPREQGVEGEPGPEVVR